MNEQIKINGKLVGEIKSDREGNLTAYNYGTPVGTYSVRDNSVRVNGSQVGTGRGALYKLIEE